MNMVMIALRDGRRSSELLKALKAAGAHNATILDNDGVHTVFMRGVRASLESPSFQTPGKTILTVVPDALTDAVVEAAERVLVGFTGMVCAWQVGHAAAYQGELRTAELPQRRYA